MYARIYDRLRMYCIFRSFKNGFFLDFWFLNEKMNLKEFSFKYIKTGLVHVCTKPASAQLLECVCAPPTGGLEFEFPDGTPLQIFWEKK